MCLPLHVFVDIEGVGVFSFLKWFKFRPLAQESSSKELKWGCEGNSPPQTPWEDNETFKVFLAEESFFSSAEPAASKKPFHPPAGMFL